MLVALNVRKIGKFLAVAALNIEYSILTFDDGIETIV